MSGKRTVRRVSDKKRNKPFIKFNFWMLVIIFGLSFLGCFLLYILAANLDDNFFDEEYTISSVEDNEDSEEIPENNGDSVSESTESVKSVINPVPESERKDDSYFENVCVISDRTLPDLKGNTTIKNVIGNAELNAVNVNECKIESAYGTITAFQSVQIIKPKSVYIMLGADLETSSADDMINSYGKLISDIMSGLPETKIYIMQIPPIYTESETISNEKINSYNSRLIELADSKNVNCIDTNTALKNNAGALDEKYWSAETESLSSVGYTALYEYILTHTTE